MYKNKIKVLPQKSKERSFYFKKTKVINKKGAGRCRERSFTRNYNKCKGEIESIIASRNVAKKEKDLYL